MSKRIDRRQALGAIGTISLGGLLAACGKDSSDGGTASVATTAGETATVEPKTTASDATSALFDDAASCALTVEQTEGPYYFDADKIRSDIRKDREARACGSRCACATPPRASPLPDAVVDIWPADAGGAYVGLRRRRPRAAGRRARRCADGDALPARRRSPTQTASSVRHDLARLVSGPHGSTSTPRSISTTPTS